MTNGDKIRQMSNEELSEFLGSKNPDYTSEWILEWLKNEWQEEKIEKIDDNKIWNNSPF
jgi:hypothetical protein